MANAPGTGNTPITIKKYANRRLYNTATSCYVTLDLLCQMVKDGMDFVVYDAKTNEDITRSVLTQIIVEEESKGQNLLPIAFLRQLISFYGDNMQWMVPRYLEQSMSSFARNQEQMRHYLQDAVNGMFPFGQFEEMGKQQVAMFERAMQMFGAPGATDTPPVDAAAGQPQQTIEELQQRVEHLQQQLQALTRQAEANRRAESVKSAKTGS